MKVIHWNGFPGLYVVSEDPSTHDGLTFHFWAETSEECHEWIENNKGQLSLL